MNNECQCVDDNKTIIKVSDYKDNNLIVVDLLVCEDCKKWYDSLRLSLSDEQVKKYFG